MERGLSEETIRGCCRTVEGFLDGWSGDLSLVRITDIDGEIARHDARGCGRSTVRVYAWRLRGFLRFAERRGWCKKGLAEGVMPPRHHPGETIPKGLSRDETLRLLATTEGDPPADIRDRAILMLLITYGLRSGEVRDLRLEDVDWKKERLRVRCTKTRRTLLRPLSRGVGHATLRYLREVRPRNRFCGGFPDGTCCDGVNENDVLRFLAGNGPLTRSRANRYGALAGFYRFAGGDRGGDGGAGGRRAVGETEAGGPCGVDDACEEAGRGQGGASTVVAAPGGGARVFGRRPRTGGRPPCREGSRIGKTLDHGCSVGRGIGNHCVDEGGPGDGAKHHAVLDRGHETGLPSDRSCRPMPHM